MHEMGIVSSILTSAEEAATREGATRITEIRITVGELTEIVDFALQFAFEALTPGTIAEGATLTVTRLGAKSRCLECQTEYEHDRFEMLCPECGSFACELLSGKELEINSIEVDPDTSPAPVSDPPAEPSQQG
ncbi:MAG: hydrogenase maturation nickel metallochaperone HypA [Actinobacteria bacterium]|nr:hydrogenase maturation nickel metallochaperone HypA [Actinomycetota bacterium]MCL5887771.1 hydrogenase maturation nickel metallochaperone HypA [Actinomycetota bacterium]